MYPIARFYLEITNIISANWIQMLTLRPLLANVETPRNHADKGGSNEL
jgi:hypothetical protein